MTRRAARAPGAADKMGQVTCNVNGRSYRLACGEGEEVRLKDVAQYVKRNVETLAKEFGQVGNERLLLMAAILIADELFDARAGGAPGAAAEDEEETPSDSVSKSGAA